MSEIVLSSSTSILIDGYNAETNRWSFVQSVEPLKFFQVVSCECKFPNFDNSEELNRLISVYYDGKRYRVPDYFGRHVRLFNRIEDANKYWSVLQGEKRYLF